MQASWVDVHWRWWWWWCRLAAVVVAAVAAQQHPSHCHACYAHTTSPHHEATPTQPVHTSHARAHAHKQGTIEPRTPHHAPITRSMSRHAARSHTTHPCTHARAYAQMHACMHARTHARTHTCTNARTHPRNHRHNQTHTHTHTNTHTHTHTHTARTCTHAGPFHRLCVMHIPHHAPHDAAHARQREGSPTKGTLCLARHCAGRVWGGVGVVLCSG